MTENFNSYKERIINQPGEKSTCNHITKIHGNKNNRPFFPKIISIAVENHLYLVYQRQQNSNRSCWNHDPFPDPTTIIYCAKAVIIILDKHSLLAKTQKR